MTEDIFGMSNVFFFKEIEKKKMGDVYTLLCLRSAEISNAFELRTLCYSRISVVMFFMVQECWNLSKARVRTKRKKCPAPKCCIFK